MIQKIYLIYDAKAEAYFPPFFLHNEGLAIRTFSQCVNSGSHPIGKNPEDFTLFEVGDFDDNKGTFKIYDAARSLGLALEYVKKPGLPMEDLLAGEANGQEEA